MSPLVDPPMSLIRVVLWEMLVLDVPRRTEILILDLPINFVPVVGQELAQEAYLRALTPIVFLNVSAAVYFWVLETTSILVLTYCFDVIR